MMWSLCNTSPMGSLETPREYASLACDDQSLEYIESFVG